jgi:hypothetical protein
MSNQKCLGGPLRAASLLAAALVHCQAAQNLLQNPGFEEPQLAPNWTATPDSAGRVQRLDRGAHSGNACLSLPAHSAISQETRTTDPGPYLFRCWVNSEAEQAVTVVLQNTTHPAASYTYADIKVRKGQWTPLEVFCAVHDTGPFTVTVGGMSGEFRKYHGGTSEMRAPILLDDFELVLYQSAPGPGVAVWDAPKGISDLADWKSASSWTPVNAASQAFQGTPVFQNRHLAGVVRPQNGTLALYAIDGQAVNARGVLLPEPALAAAQCSMTQENGRTGVRVTGADGRGYSAWLSPKGMIKIEPHNIARFRISECQLAYGLLPSFIGTDICYAPEKLGPTSDIQIPSTQWFVGLRDSHDSMLVSVWESPAQTASLRLTGTGKDRRIDTLSLDTGRAGFSLSFVEHPNLWFRQTLNEDWLGEYTPLSWERPFPARWMAHFFVSNGGKASFRTPHMDYSFPVADAKTRMWGVWFEDWNHYPFFCDGPRLIAHFEKTFVPKGEALIYFLEPAAVDLFSPCEIVEQALGSEKAAALFDFDANQLRKLHYSTPNDFMYDRPVCATTTRLSSIKKEEKPTVGVNLATHLYEFIREIRGRVDQYVAFFDQMKGYLETQDQAHTECHAYIANLLTLVAEARSKAQDIYNTPLSAVQSKTDSMRNLLLQGKGDGFDCGTLDVRGPAGAQDDLCRRYNRMVLRLSETAALNCGNSPVQAAVATHIWQESREVLRQPTRWEPRRTLYFFEP